jgi:riboflavin synthase
MFTGLIEEVGTIAEVTRGRGLRLAVRAQRVLAELKVGESIAVSGPCLTVERLANDRFYVSLLPETVQATTLAAAQVGRRVNLERPLRLSDRLSGHLVTGHVDGTAQVVSAQDRGGTRLLELLCPPGLEQYLVDRGSVALDGVSLTVRAPAGRRFSVALVRATLAATTLGELRVGDRVNLEVDLLAKHVERLLGGRPDSPHRSAGSISPAAAVPAAGSLAAWAKEVEQQ